MAKLTAKQIENINSSGFHEDGNGLRLRVLETGQKYWYLRYQIKGKRRQMSLGHYPQLSLKQARNEAAKQHALIYEGIDPIENRKQARTLAEQQIKADAAAQISFAELAELFIQNHEPTWKNAKHIQQWQNTLKTYAFPVIGTLSASEIETRHIEQILDPIWNAKPETADRLRGRIERVLDFAKVKKLREGENPALWRGHLDKLYKKPNKRRTVKHHPALPWQELPRFVSELRQCEGLGAQALLMTILTATRTSEVLLATWDEVNLTEKTWVLPGSRTKTGKEHRVPLSEPAQKLVASIPCIDGSLFLFPGQRPGRPLSNMTMTKVLKRMGRDGITVHGFRSTFRDWAGESTHHPREVCEMALGHAIGNAVENAYRRGDLFEKRRALMNDWANFILPPTPDRVVVLFHQEEK